MAKEVNIKVKGVRLDEPDLRKLARFMLRQILEADGLPTSAPEIPSDAPSVKRERQAS